MYQPVSAAAGGPAATRGRSPARLTGWAVPAVVLGVVAGSVRLGVGGHEGPTVAEQVRSSVRAGAPAAARPGLGTTGAVALRATHTPRDPFAPLVGAAATGGSTTVGSTSTGAVGTGPAGTSSGQATTGTTATGSGTGATTGTTSTPSTASASGATAAGQPAQPVSPGTSRHVVKPGETLWTIAAAASPAGASNAAVAAEVTAIYQANTTVLASTSAPLLSGTVLQVPLPPYAG